MTQPGCRLLKSWSILIQLIEDAAWVSLEDDVFSVPCSYKDIVDLSNTGLTFAYYSEFTFEPSRVKSYVIVMSLKESLFKFIPLLIKSDCHVTLQKTPRKKGKA